MRLVIDIPDEDYNVILANADLYKEKNWGVAEVWDAIVTGIPLPKGHGDLIDRNTVQMSAEKFHSLGDLHIAQWVVDNTPVVISEDKGE